MGHGGIPDCKGGTDDCIGRFGMVQASELTLSSTPLAKSSVLILSGLVQVALLRWHTRMRWYYAHILLHTYRLPTGCTSLLPSNIDASLRGPKIWLCIPENLQTGLTRVQTRLLQV